MSLYPPDTATDAQRRMLDHARDLQLALEAESSASPPPDDVLELVADLLGAHADTGIEMQTWPRALAVVESHLAASERGRAELHASGVHAWFTVVGTWRDGRPEPVAVVPGRRSLDLALGCWQQHVHSPSIADAVGAAIDELTAITVTASDE